MYAYVSDCTGVSVLTLAPLSPKKSRRRPQSISYALFYFQRERIWIWVKNNVNSPGTHRYLLQYRSRFYGMRKVIQNSLFSITQGWIKRSQKDQCESCMEVRSNELKANLKSGPQEKKNVLFLSERLHGKLGIGMLLLRKYLLFFR